MNLSTKVLAALFLGIGTGLFFGELTEPLQVVGDAFIQLLQMAVLPYVVVSLIAGLGSLSVGEARQLASRGGAVLLSLWALAFLLVALTPLCFPESQEGTFFRAESLQPPAQLDFLALYITSNPFHALANNVVPAVVLFSSLLGIALIGVETRKPLLGGLHTLSNALLRVTGFIVRLTPIGVFAISAHLAGTATIEDLGRIQVFLWTYLAFVLVLAFWILPGVLAAFTPLRYRTILAVSRDAMVTAFATGSAFVVLPLLAESGKRLLTERHLEHEDSAALVDVIIPLAQTFPHAAKVLSLSFVLFAGWFVGSPLAFHDYPLLGFAGIMSLFGSVHLAIPYMLDVMQVPVDTYGVFVTTSVINARFGTLGAAMHILTLTLLSTCAITGGLSWKWPRTVRFVLTSAAVLTLSVVGVRTLFHYTVAAQNPQAEVLRGMYLTEDIAPATVYREKAPFDPLPAGVSRVYTIQERGVLRVGYQKIDRLPFAFFNSAGELVGLDIDMAHSLARSLGVAVEFVPIEGTFGATEDLAEPLSSGYCDIIMSGRAISVLQGGKQVLNFSRPYLDLNMGYLVRDHRRREFANSDVLAERRDLRIAVPSVPYYIDRARRYLPRSELVPVDSVEAFLDAAPGEFDAMIFTAEASTAWSLLRAEFTSVIPRPEREKIPLGYPLPAGDGDWMNAVNSWIELKLHDGTIKTLYDYWVRGVGAELRTPRWSVMRDVLGWTD